MKKIIIYITVLAAFAAVSCSHSEVTTGFKDGSTRITLNLSTGDLATKSDIPAVESEVSQFDWFFYADATGTSEPVYHGHFDVDGTTLTYTAGTEPSAYTADSEGYHLGFDIENTFTDLNGAYYVYVLANYDGIDHSDASALTLETLLAKTLTTQFDELNSSYSAINNFVMDSYSGDDDATYPQLVPLTAVTDDDNDGKGNLAVPLRRVAAKISFILNISDQIASGSTFWRPLTGSSNYTTYLVNAASYATVKGEALDADEIYELGPNPSTGVGTYQISYNTAHVKTQTDEDGLVWEIDPFYTYPVSFDPAKNSAPYLKISLPWENVDGEGNLTALGATLFYYKVYLLDPETNEPLTSYERNKHYIVTVNVDTLGGTQEDYTVLETNYYVADWQSPSDGTYSGYFAPRFLDVAKDTYYIYGDNSTTISVTSSHNISATITAVSQKKIDGSNKMTTVPSSASVTTEGKVSFTLNYELNTTLSSGSMDVTPIYWTINIYHTDKTSIAKTVTVIQYPSIYVETKTTSNSSSRFVQTLNSSGTAYNNTSYSLGNVGGGGGGGSLSSDKTILTVSTLASLTGTYDWVLGESRVRLSTLLPLTINSETWNETDLGTASEYINNYLIADPDKTNYIAPRFMLASGLGANTKQGVWKSNAERCAAYQEDGYPAGRWRLPTEAEILFCRLLQSYSYIGSVFQSSNFYWANTGRYITSSGTFTQGASNSSCSVRCIYDLWYWGDEPYDNNGNKITDDSGTPATTWLGFMTD